MPLWPLHCGRIRVMKDVSTFYLHGDKYWLGLNFPRPFHRIHGKLCYKSEKNPSIQMRVGHYTHHKVEQFSWHQSW